jgi:simple sugar transport system substrate-binding protein
VLPSEARELIITGAIRAGFLWSPLDAGAALAGVAGMTFTGRLLRTGVEIPGLGLAKIDTDHRLITTNRIFDVNRTTLDGLIALGL